MSRSSFFFLFSPLSLLFLLPGSALGHLRQQDVHPVGPPFGPNTNSNCTGVDAIVDLPGSYAFTGKNQDEVIKDICIPIPLPGGVLRVDSRPLNSTFSGENYGAVLFRVIQAFCTGHDNPDIQYINSYQACEFTDAPVDMPNTWYFGLLEGNRTWGLIYRLMSCNTCGANLSFSFIPTPSLSVVEDFPHTFNVSSYPSKGLVEESWLYYAQVSGFTNSSTLLVKVEGEGQVDVYVKEGSGKITTTSYDHACGAQGPCYGFTFEPDKVYMVMAVGRAGDHSLKTTLSIYPGVLHPSPAPSSSPSPHPHGKAGPLPTGAIIGIVLAVLVVLIIIVVVIIVWRRRRHSYDRSGRSGAGKPLASDDLEPYTDADGYN